MSGDTRTTSPIAVCDPVPLVRYGLEQVLGEAVCTIDTAAVPVWAGRETSEVAVISMVDEEAWRVVRRVGPQGTVQVVALLDRPRRYEATAAVSAGASAVWSRSGSPEEIAAVVTCVQAGSAVVPASVLTGTPPPDSWSAEERAWLIALYRGMSVTELAWQTGYSKRTMARRLRQLYRRLDADGLRQALAAAARLGLLDASDP